MWLLILSNICYATCPKKARNLNYRRKSKADCPFCLKRPQIPKSSILRSIPHVTSLTTAFLVPIRNVYRRLSSVNDTPLRRLVPRFVQSALKNCWVIFAISVHHSDPNLPYHYLIFTNHTPHTSAIRTNVRIRSKTPFHIHKPLALYSSD